MSPEAIDFISSEGYDPVYGARPLKRAIQKYLLDPLSLNLLNGDYSTGDIIDVSVDSGILIFEKKSEDAELESKNKEGFLSSFGYFILN